MKAILLSVALTVMAAIPSVSYLSPPISSQPETAEALLDRELYERELAFTLAPIKSAADLQEYIANNRDGNTPLGLLSSGAQERFLQSLVFTERGLASFDYRDIRAELTASQVYELLSLFGVQRSTAAIPNLRVTSSKDEIIAPALCPGCEDVENPGIDYPGYWCASQATCRKSAGAICIGDNC